MDLAQPVHPSSTSYLTSPTYPTPHRLLSQPPSPPDLRSQSNVTSQKQMSASRSSPVLHRPGAFTPEHHQHLHQHHHQHPRPPLNGKRPIPTRKRPSQTKAVQSREEDSWLLRTASSIALSSLEEDGLSWLSKRESSTSLHDLKSDITSSSTAIKERNSHPETSETETLQFDDEDNLENLFHTSPLHTPGLPSPRVYSRMHSGRTSRVVSKPGSRVMSRVSLALPEEGHEDAEGREAEGKGTSGMKSGGPDWVDPEEIRRVEKEMADNLALKERGDGDEDGVNESEMQKVVLGRVGGWVDWAVGWMEGREGEDQQDDDDNADGTAAHFDQSRKQKDVATKSKMGNLAIDPPHPPPPPPPSSAADAGVLADAKWLLGVAKQVAI